MTLLEFGTAIIGSGFVACDLLPPPATLSSGTSMAIANNIELRSEANFGTIAPAFSSRSIENGS